MDSCTEIITQLEEMEIDVQRSFTEVMELDGASKSILNAFTDQNKLVDENSLLKIQAVIDLMYEKINIGDWKDVKLFLRKTITIASYIKILYYLKCCTELSETVYSECFKIIDFGHIFGCPLDSNSGLLTKCGSVLNSYQNTTKIKSITNEIINEFVQDLSTEHENYYNATAIEVIDNPSMENFFKMYISHSRPVILTNCINHWPALSKWRDPNYLLQLAGPRTVPVEIGSKYTDTDWTQKLMTFKDFINNHIYQSNGPTGYLAQYQLFDQIPELKKDIMEPEYCCFADSNEPVDIMAWFGPKGTVSPLHHDPKKNLLAQVIGEKNIFLFHPEESKNLYPHEHHLLNNTAKVDPRKPDFAKYPDYTHAKPLHCVLKPGQILFIPPKWWHFVESLSVSFSVSFWWE